MCRKSVGRVVCVILAGTLIFGCAYFSGEQTGGSKDSQVARPAAGAVKKADLKAFAEFNKLQRGQAIYRHACQTCHGVRGDGAGQTARHLDPLPRNFTLGAFKFRSTKTGALPTDGDLERTIREGVPGTDMPAFGPVFSLADQMALVAYIKAFSPKFNDPVFALQPDDLVKIPEKRPAPATPGSIALGKKVYEKMECAKCHGELGRGDGPSSIAGLKDDLGRPIEAYDFTNGVYKSGRNDADLYRSFTTGLNGTPMPAFGRLLTDKQRWALVDYMKTLSPERNFFVRLFTEKPE